MHMVVMLLCRAAKEKAREKKDKQRIQKVVLV